MFNVIMFWPFFIKTITTIFSSDEQNCSNVECPRDYFSCGPGECIHQKLVCDQHADCSTLLDEVDCAIKTVQSCAEDEFKCNSSLSCIDFANVCDGEANCNRGEDERNCSGCRPSEFECNDKRCIRLEFRCDQQKDCENGTFQKIKH